MRVVPSMASRSGTLIPADPPGGEPQDGRYVRGVKSNVVPGKGSQISYDQVISNTNRLDKTINLSLSLIHI